MTCLSTNMKKIKVIVGKLNRSKEFLKHLHWSNWRLVFNIFINILIYACIQYLANKQFIVSILILLPKQFCRKYYFNIYAFNLRSYYILTLTIWCLNYSLDLPSNLVDDKLLKYNTPGGEIWDSCTFLCELLII